MTSAPRFPAPAHLSDRARATLSAAPPPAQFPDHADDAGWKAFAENADAVIGQMVAPHAPPVVADKREANGVPVYVVHAPGFEPDATTTLNLDIHGGALYAGGGDLIPPITAIWAHRSKMEHWAVDYRMLPDHPHPAGLDDVVSVYKALLEIRDSGKIVVSGASAGGNLAAALILRLKDERLPLPAALVLQSPELDLTESGDSFTTLAEASTLLGSLMPVNLKHANGADLADPFISPLFGDVTDFPPTILTAGTRDLFLSNAVRMHRKLRAAEVDAELHVYEAMPHGGFGGAPEDKEVHDEFDRFLTRLGLI